MSEFNYTEYLKNNPLLKKEAKQSLNESQRPGYHADGTPKSNDEMSDDEREEFYNDSNFIDEEKSSTKMKVSELKAKIKEDIISTLSEQDEDYEQASREMEYGISPEGGDLEDELMQDLEENHQSLDSEIANRIEGLLNIPMKKQFLEIGKDLIQDLIQDDPFDIDDIISHLANELIKYTQDLQTTPLNEEKKEEDEEDVDVEVEDDLDIESEEGGEEMEAEPEDAGVSAEAGFSKEEKDIQDGLKQAYDQAVAVGDEKLADQIGNTITMFTRTHVVNR